MLSTNAHFSANPYRHPLIPDNLHQPLEQGFIITKRAENNGAAKRFADYMVSSPARAIMKKYGFALPGEVTNE